MHGAKDQHYQRVDDRVDVTTIAKTEFAKQVGKIQWDNAPLIKVRMLRSEQQGPLAHAGLTRSLPARNASLTMPFSSTPSTTTMCGAATTVWSLASIDRSEHELTVAGCTPYLRKYIRDRSKGPIDNADAQSYLQAINELARFMLVDGVECVVSRCCLDAILTCCRDKKRQKLLRNYGTVELIILTLRAPFKEYNNEQQGSKVPASVVVSS
jgi:hypothetical protein